MKTNLVFAGVLLGATLTQGQVMLTSDDMFNSTGQFYRVYANSANVDVTGLLGNTNGPQNWNFTNGPQDIIYRFDYVSTADGGNGASFPLAKYAERQTNESTGTTSAWTYLQQVPGTGRRVYGYVNPKDDPKLAQFNPPIVDFPDPLKYQNSWTAATSYDFNVQDLLPARINYTETSSVDAYGTIALPRLGSMPCLRVNILEQYDVLVDLDLTGNYQQYETDYIRSYYFLSPAHGIVAEVHSPQSTAAPPANGFTTAHQFTRMFELSRAALSQAPAPVADLKLTVAGNTGLLSWSQTTNTVSYRVEYTSSLGGTNGWQSLGTTTKDFLLDPTLANSPQRFYRVVSLPQ